MSLFNKVTKVAGNVTKAVAKPLEKAGKAALKQATSAATLSTKTAISAASAVVRQAEGAVKKSASTVTKAAVDAAKNALDSTKILADGVDLAFKLGSLNPMIATQLALGKSIANGESLIKAAEAAVKAGVKSTKEALQYAEMVAPFVPGIGSGAAAALGAAGALANGKSITDAMLAAARGALPGGAIAQQAFDVGVGLARGKNVTAVALEAARAQLPLGKESRMAFDAAVALGRAQSLQKALPAAGRRAASRYAADATEFVRALKSDTNIQTAALSREGQAVFQRSKRAAEIDGRRHNGQRIDKLVQRRQHIVRVPKQVTAAVKRELDRHVVPRSRPGLAA